jgi:hypothetical protein
VSSSIFSTLSLLIYEIVSSSVFLALLLSSGCEKQPRIGRAPMALIQAVKTTRDRFECRLIRLTLIQAWKDLGLRAQASFQLFCSHPVVKNNSRSVEHLWLSSKPWKQPKIGSSAGLLAFLLSFEFENCSSVLSSPLWQEELCCSICWAALHEKVHHFYTGCVAQLMLETEVPCWLWWRDWLCP